MIYGIGTDIVAVARMGRALQRHGARFAERILGAAELADFQVAVHPARFLAKRFAAKEAASKALGTGFSQGLSLHDICVAHDAAGKPMLHFSGRALDLLEARGIGEHFLSLADEHDYAIAYVTLLRR
ncbi:holo-ACP synthase [Sulfurivermis fontis]|uniref:holo-ACP synthase n=1 Tax=Sulfurivermis fontis TaxID=1972068 RepID=UPI000FD90E6C|nr:holo-ACP synthase [Sulfurivermis fontis]